MIRRQDLGGREWIVGRAAGWNRRDMSWKARDTKAVTGLRHKRADSSHASGLVDDGRSTALQLLQPRWDVAAAVWTGL